MITALTMLLLVVRSRFAPLILFSLPPPPRRARKNVLSENNVIDAIHQLEEMEDLERGSEVKIFKVCTKYLLWG